MRTLFVFIVLSINLCSAQQYTWVQKSSFPSFARGACASFSIGNKGYVGAGFNAGGAFNDFWSYDPATDTWSQIASLPQAVLAPVAFEVNGFGYVGTGFDLFTYTSNFYKYDPIANTWALTSVFPGGSRYTSIAFVLNNLVYFGTGYSPYYNDLWQFDPVTNVWTQLASLPATGRQSSAAFTIGNYGFVYGGSTGSSIENELWRFNPVNNSWLQRANCPISRYGSVSFSYNNFGVIGVGCTTPAQCFTEFYIYNNNTDTWCFMTSYPGQPIRHSAPFKINNKIYFCTGVYGSNTGTNELWELTIAQPSIQSNIFCDSVVFSSTLPTGTISSTWHFGDGDTSTQISPIHVYTNSGLYTVSLVVEYGCGRDSITQLVNAGATPQAAFSYTLDSCNYTITLNNTTQSGNTFTWNFGDGDTSNQSQPSHTYTSAGTYTVFLTAASACGQDTLSQTVLIPSPSVTTASFNFTIDSCQQSVSLLNQSSGANSYQWSFGDNTSSVSASPSHIYNTPGNYVVQLVSYGSCTSDTITQNITIPAVNVPNALFSLTLDTCNQEIQIINNSSAASAYQWTFGDGNGSNASQPSHIYSDSGSYNVTLIAYGDCTNDTITLNTYIPSVINPVAAFTVDLDMCQYSIQLTNNSTAANGNTWYFGDGNSSAIQQPVHVYADSGTYTISLVVNGTCTSDSTAQVINVPYAAIANAAFTATLDTCQQLLQLNNQSSNATSYTWNFGDQSTSTSINPAHQYSNGGNYIVQLIASGLCNIDTFSQAYTIVSGNSLLAAIDPLIDTCDESYILIGNPEAENWAWTINGIPYTGMQLTLPSSDPLNILLIVANSCTADSIQLNLPAVEAPVPELIFNFSVDTCTKELIIQNSSTNYQGIQWNFGDGNSSAQTSPNHTYTSSGTYQVQVALFGNCDTITRNFDLNISQGDTGFYLPNAFTPNNDGMNDIYTVNGSVSCDVFDVSIYNRWGQLMYSGNITGGWDGKFGGQPCTEGIYYCTVKSEKKTYTTSLLLIR